MSHGPALLRAVAYYQRAAALGTPEPNWGRTSSMRKIAGNPYPGWRAFQEDDHDHFCGRKADIAAVVNLWTANRLTVVSGAVASGKTSLLQAGVYPAMRDNRAVP